METREGKGSQTKQRDKENTQQRGLHGARSEKNSTETDSVQSEAREGQERKIGAREGQRRRDIAKDIEHGNSAHGNSAHGNSETKRTRRNSTATNHRERKRRQIGKR